VRIWSGTDWRCLDGRRLPPTGPTRKPSSFGAVKVTVAPRGYKLVLTALSRGELLTNSQRFINKSRLSYHKGPAKLTVQQILNDDKSSGSLNKQRYN
jgi:hypothetical protein